MPDLETLSASNRSIWQPMSYMEPLDTYVGNKGKLAALKGTQLEFDKADAQTSALKDIHAKARSLSGDNPFVKGYLDTHEQQLNDLANSSDPYQIQRGVKKLANQYMRDINDDNTKLGVAVKNDAIHSANLQKAKDDDELLLAREQEALYNKADKDGRMGAEKYYDPIRQSYKGASLKPLETVEVKTFGQYFNDTLDKWTSDKKSTASFGIEARKGSDGNYMVTRTGSNEGVDKIQAREAAVRAYDTNPALQAQVKQQATVDAIRKYGLGNTDNSQVQQFIKNRENELGNEFKDQFYNKLQFNKQEKDIKGNADPYSLMAFKAKGVAEILNKPLEKPNIGGGVYKNNNLQFSKDINMSEKIINNKVITDGNEAFKPSEVADIAYNRGLISKDEKIKLENYLLSKTEGVYSSKFGLTEGLRDDKMAENTLGKLGISVQKVTDNVKLSLDQKEKAFDYGIVNEQYPDVVEQIKSLPLDKQEEAMDRFIFNHKNDFAKIRKDYLSALEQKGTRTSQASDKARKELSYPENIIPDELNTSIAYADNRGNGAVNKNKAPIEFLKDAGVELDAGDKYRFDLVGTNLTHPNLAGGKEYKVTVNKKNGEQKIFSVLTEPSVQQKKNLQPIRVLNETFSSGYPSKSYFVLSNGQMEKLDDESKVAKARSEGKLITLQPSFSKGENESTVNGYVVFQGQKPITLEQFNMEYEKAVAPKSEQSLEYNIDARDVKNYNILNDILDNKEDGEESQ